MATDSDSSDSENDERIKKLLEATDKEFLNDSLYKNETNGLKQPKSDERPPSLRKSKDDDEEYNFFRVTPGFRKYVAKNLDRRIEESVEYTENCNKQKKTKRKKKTSGGVKLFKDSDDFLVTEDETVVSTANCDKPRKRPHIQKLVDEDSMTDKYEKIKSVAVSPEDILSQKGTENWTYKSKVFKYKESKDGTLVSVDP